MLHSLLVVHRQNISEENNILFTKDIFQNNRLPILQHRCPVSFKQYLMVSSAVISPANSMRRSTHTDDSRKHVHLHKKVRGRMS